MNNIQDKIYLINDQFSDILEAMKATFIFDLKYEYAKNYGAQDNEQVLFTATINDIPYKDKVFTRSYLHTEEAFINEIKSYLFSVLDGVANL